MTLQVLLSKKYLVIIIGSLSIQKGGWFPSSYHASDGNFRKRRPRPFESFGSVAHLPHVDSAATAVLIHVSNSTTHRDVKSMIVFKLNLHENVYCRSLFLCDSIDLKTVQSDRYIDIKQPTMHKMGPKIPGCWRASFEIKHSS